MDNDETTTGTSLSGDRSTSKRSRQRTPATPATPASSAHARGRSDTPTPAEGPGDRGDSTPGRSGEPAFLGRPDPGEGPEEFTLRFLEALIGKDDPRVKKYREERGLG